MAQRSSGLAGVDGGENLILTPSKLRLYSYVFGPYVTSLWLPNSIFAALLLWKIAYAAPLAWWTVFLPLWIGHGGHLLLVLSVLLNADKLVEQQLGPAPPARASPGMVLQYSTMMAERRASVLVDNISSLVEGLAGVAVKSMVCKALTEGKLGYENFSWRLLMLPVWIGWFITFVMSLFKPRRERTMGSMRDLLFICLLFVSLKLDGVAAYTWSVVFLIPWMWFGALFLGAIVTACVIVVAYACMDMRELALPGGFLLLLLSAAAQLPFFIYLCSYLEGDTSITLQQILIPQIASWFAMWVSGLIICYGLYKKEQLRARLAAAGQVWTAHESAARELMSLELEDMRAAVDKMSDEELAQVAMRMMAGKAQPQQLLRVGSTLYRRALSFSAGSPKGTMSVIRRLDGDGTAQLGELMGAAAMEEGRPWPDLPSQAGDEHGAVCVSVQLRPRQQATPAAASAAAVPAGGADTSVDKPQQEQQPTNADVTVDVAAAAGEQAVNQVDSSKAAADAAAAVPAAAALRLASPCGDADDGLCTICYDNHASCVFMECGHGGYCWRCAHLLFARPPSECPVCRQPIQQVVELEDPAGGQVGVPVRVKAHASTRSSSGDGGAKGSGGGWFKG